MRTRLLLLAAVVLLVVTVTVHATYSYYYTENLASPNWSNWTVTPGQYDTLSSQYFSAGGYSGLTGTGTMLNNTRHYQGGEVSMTFRFSGASGDDYFTAYMASQDLALADGNYDSVQITGGPRGGSIFLGQTCSNSYYSLGYVNTSIPDGSVVRAVALPGSSGDTLVVYVNNVLAITASAPCQLTSFYDYWGVGANAADPTDGNLMSSVSLGNQDTVAPYPVASSSITDSAYYNSVALQWGATTDNPGGTGVYDYSVYRNGQLLGTTQSLSYSDTSGIVPNTSYTYTITATDYHLNSAGTNVTIKTPAVPTNPPYPSSTPSGRRTGVRTTGAYWGASGENIDVLSGNLSFSQPLLSAQGRDGWSVNFNLIYNSQNWSEVSGIAWQYGLTSAMVSAGSSWPARSTPE